MSRHQGVLGYNICFERNAIALIEAYPPYSHSRSLCFIIYSFENNTAQTLITNIGECEAYFNGNGEFIIIGSEFDYNNIDSVNYLEGTFRIYNSSTGQLVKTLSLPPNGRIYTFDNYPNDIYYVLNLETQPDVYNLTKLELHNITPSVAITSLTSRDET